MKNQYWLVCFLFLMAASTLTACKKNVAAAPPAAAPVQPAARPPAPTITVRAASATIDRGQATSLQWEAKNATTVRIDPEIGNVQSQGSRSVNPASSITYTATAAGPGGSASDSARITVRVPPPAAPVRPPQTRTEAPVSIDELFRQNVQAIYFDYDKADIRPDQVARLQAAASWLREHRGVKFTIDGNADERGSEEYNLGLGDRRANSVKEFLIQNGVDQPNVNTMSYGEERPVCKELSEQCHQRNRRAGFSVRRTS